MDTATFYATTSAVSFTLLGFWWVVVQFRHDEMTGDPGRRRLAFVVSLHFILPGLMSLGALLTGDAPIVWRLTFGTAGIAGMVAVVLASRGVTDPTGAIAAVGRYEWLALPLYAILTLVAFFPGLHPRHVQLMPLQVEGAVMTFLVVPRHRLRLGAVHRAACRPVERRGLDGYRRGGRRAWLGTPPPSGILGSARLRAADAQARAAPWGPDE